MENIKAYFTLQACIRYTINIPVAYAPVTTCAATDRPVTVSCPNSVQVCSLRICNGAYMYLLQPAKNSCNGIRCKQAAR